MLPHSGPFVARLLSALKADGVEVRSFELDHLCYRVTTPERYAELRTWLLTQGVLLGESPIGGRPIATFGLKEPWLIGDRRIEVVELPSPKDGSPYAEGWEHAEFVIGEDLLSFTQRHPHLSWDLSDLHKPVNADVRLRYEGFSVKFHRHALAYVIAHLDR